MCLNICEYFFNRTRQRHSGCCASLLGLERFRWNVDGCHFSATLLSSEIPNPTAPGDSRFQHHPPAKTCAHGQTKTMDESPSVSSSSRYLCVRRPSQLVWYRQSDIVRLPNYISSWRRVLITCGAYWTRHQVLGGGFTQSNLSRAGSGGDRRLCRCCCRRVVTSDTRAAHGSRLSLSSLRLKRVRTRLFQDSWRLTVSYECYYRFFEIRKLNVFFQKKTEW